MIQCICVNRLGYYSILNHSSNFEIKYNNIIVTDRPVSLTQVLISHTCTSSARSWSHTTKAHTAASVLVRSCDYNVDSTPGIVTSIQFMYLPGYSYLPSVLSSSVEILHCLLQSSSNGNTEVCASSDLSSDSRKTKIITHLIYSKYSSIAGLAHLFSSPNLSITHLWKTASVHTYHLPQTMCYSNRKCLFLCRHIRKAETTHSVLVGSGASLGSVCRGVHWYCNDNCIHL